MNVYVPPPACSIRHYKGMYFIYNSFLEKRVSKETPSMTQAQAWLTHWSAHE